MPSRRDQAANLAAAAGELFQNVEKQLLYIDTVRVMIPRMPSAHELKTVRNSCDGAVFPSPFSRQLRNHCPGKYKAFLKCHLPTSETLRLIARFWPNHRIQRIDVAWDLIMPTLQLSEAAQVFFARKLSRLWPGKAKSKWVSDTWYSGSRNTRRIVAIYADRTSKIVQEPCLHVEIRLQRASACRRLGLSTVGDIPSFDARALLCKFYRFSSVTPRALDKVIEAEAQQYMKTSNRRMDRPTTVRWLKELIAALASGPTFSVNADNLADGSIEALVIQLPQLKRRVVSSRLDPFLKDVALVPPLTSKPVQRASAECHACATD